MKAEEEKELLEKIKKLSQEAAIISRPITGISKSPDATLLVLLLLQLRELTEVLNSIETAINNIGTDDYPLEVRDHHYR